MLFDVSTAPQLKPWLVRTLEPICDAEPGALAEYILALLKHNVPENDMRRELTAQLDEFLEKECSSFIDTLFKVLRTKTYLPYHTDSTPKQPRAMDTGIPIPLDALLSPTSPERGQKRSMDHDDRDGRPAKGPRLSMDGGQVQFSRYPNGMGNGQWGGRGGMNGHGGGINMGVMGMNGGVNGNIGQMNGRGPQGYQPPDQKRGLCRDYHSYGYCARGELCKYSHGEEAVIPQLFPMNGQQMTGIASQMPYIGMFPNGGMPFGMNGNVGGAYDPNEAHMDMRPLQQGMGMGIGAGVGAGVTGIVGGRSRAPILPRIQQEGGSGSQLVHNTNASGELPVIQDLTPKVPTDDSQPQSEPQSHNNVGQEYGPDNEIPGMFMEVDDGARMTSHVAFRGGMHGGGRGRGTLSNHGGAQPVRPQKGRGDKTLVVEKIPEDKLSLDAVNGWFKRFGTVTNVAIDARSAKALVTFAEHDEAHKAWKSEDAVFNNRFVKLFWHRPMEGHGQGGVRALAASASLVANINGKEAAPAPSTNTTQPAASTNPGPSTSAKRKPAAPSAVVSALAAKQQLLEQQIAEQKSLMVQLMSASADEKKEIMARLRKLGEEMKPPPSPAATPVPSPSAALTSQKRAISNPQSDEQERKERERLDKELEYHSTTSQIDGNTEETTEDLKAKLARLKAEAASLGLPEASEALTHNASYRPPYRGRGRAARGYYRGTTLRGGVPRASMKLDNRPRKLLVKGVGDDGVQAVRDWYETTGLESVETAHNGNVVVSFKSRSAAEQGLAKGQNISKIGPVHVSWYSGQPSVTTKSTATLPAAKDVKVDKAAGDDLAPSSHEEHEQHHSPHAEEEVVANGWGGDGDEDGMGML